MVHATEVGFAGSLKQLIGFLVFVHVWLSHTSRMSWIKADGFPRTGIKTVKNDGTDL